MRNERVLVPPEQIIHFEPVGVVLTDITGHSDPHVHTSLALSNLLLQSAHENSLTRKYGSLLKSKEALSSSQSLMSSGLRVEDLPF